MANVSIMPFGGATSLEEVPYVLRCRWSVSLLISNVHTAERTETFIARFLLYPTITAIIHGLAAPEQLWFGKQNALAVDASLPVAQRNVHSEKAVRSRTKLLAMETLAAAPGELYQVSQCSFAFFDINDTLDATARPTDRAEKGNNRARSALANAFKAESGVMTVLQRTNGISPEHTRLGWQISDRLTSTPLGGSTEIKAKLTGKVVPEPVRLVIPSKETTKMITESIKTKLHVAACSGANATDGTDAMRPWGFDGLALEKLNNPIASVERIPHVITDDTAVAAWAAAFVAAAAADDTAVSCTHQHWTKDGGGAFAVVPVNANREAALIWQVEE